MLTPYDIDVMKTTVMDILESWGTRANIYIQKPEDEQPNWNPIMREYIGDIAYDILEGVPAEKLEVVNEYQADTSHIKAGNKTESGIQYKFPTIFNDKPLIITSDMLFTFDGNENDKYQVNTIRNRIGETIVDLDLLNGGTDSGRPSGW